MILKLAAMSLFMTTAAVANTKGKVYFISPKDGATVSQTVKMSFGEKELKVVPAGKDVEDKKSGHYHVLVDQDFTAEGQVIPADETHIHYGKAQKEAEVKLTPGPHKLTLQFADGAHRSYGKDLSQTINITVK